jgi:flagellar biosynthesis component FlhA
MELFAFFNKLIFVVGSITTMSIILFIFIGLPIWYIGKYKAEERKMKKEMYRRKINAEAEALKQVRRIRQQQYPERTIPTWE